MSIETSLNILEKRNDSLKSQLLHEQFKQGNFPNRYFKKEMLNVLNGYKKHKSIVKAASLVGVDANIAMNWYIQGQLGDSNFRKFFLGINGINNVCSDTKVKVTEINEGQETVNEGDFQGDYKISRYGDGWSYKTYVDGEKIFLISADLDKLKQKVKAKRLPID